MLVRIVRGMLTSTTYRYRFKLSLEDWVRQILREPGGRTTLAMMFAIAISHFACGLFALWWLWHWPSISMALVAVWMLVATPLFTNSQIHWWRALKEADAFASRAL